jgi:hypothetical protein
MAQLKALMWLHIKAFFIPQNFILLSIVAIKI